MKKEVIRYELKVDPIQTIQLPYDAKVLDITLIGKTPTLWALVNLAYKDRLFDRTFVMVEKEVPERIHGADCYVGMIEFKAEVGSKFIHEFEQ